MTSDSARLGIRAVRLASAMVAFLSTAACEHLPLYNKEKDELAQSAKAAYAEAKVAEALTVQAGNLDRLLKAEVEALNDSAALRLDINLLRMAADREQPGGATSLAAWYNQAGVELKALGFANSSQVKSLQDHNVERREAWEQLGSIRDVIAALNSGAKAALPRCPVDPSDESAWKKHLNDIKDADVKSVLSSEYAKYTEECKKAEKPAPVGNGLVGSAFRQLTAARDEHLSRKLKLKELTAAIRTSAEELKKARQARNTQGKELADLRKKIAKRLEDAKRVGKGLADVVEALRKEAGAEGTLAVANEKIAAINRMIAALSSGEANAEGIKDERLRDAVAQIATHVPTLAGDMEALIKAGTTPPVSHLVLALQHQTIEKAYAKTLVDLADKRLSILNAHYRARSREAVAWRAFGLALCDLAIQPEDRVNRSSECDSFEVELKSKKVERDSKTEVNCRLEGKPISNCVLSKTWHDAFDEWNSASTELKKVQKKKLYRALYHYAEASEAERKALESEFILADLQHREILAAQRSAAEAWNNIVVVPLEQLAAYHASGIKPEAVAEAVAVILGLAAVGAGAAQ